MIGLFAKLATDHYRRRGQLNSPPGERETPITADGTNDIGDRLRFTYYPKAGKLEISLLVLDADGLLKPGKTVTVDRRDICEHPDSFRFGQETLRGLHSGSQKHEPGQPVAAQQLGSRRQRRRASRERKGDRG